LKTSPAKHLHDREAVLPSDFGGLGDSVADDTAAIQTCFDWPAPGIARNERVRLALLGSRPVLSGVLTSAWTQAWTIPGFDHLRGVRRQLQHA
jgi:hypothetical protein